MLKLRILLEENSKDRFDEVQGSTESRIVN